MARNPNPKANTRIEVLIQRNRVLAAFAGGGAVVPRTSWTQAAWFVDPQNVTGLAKDTNDGKTALTPVRTYTRGVAAKWGTYSPRLRQNTTITFLSSHSDNSDPVYCNPIIENGAVVTIQGATLGSVGAPQITAGKLAAVVAKNRGTPQILQADLGAVAAVGNFLVNSTRGNARCWVQKNTAGTTFHLTQPFSPLAIPVQFAAPVEVDTFATGDDFILFQKTRINFAELLPTVVDANASFNNLLQVFNCVAVDLSGVTGGGGLQSNASTVFAEAQIERGLLLVPTLGVTGTQGVYNCVGRVSSGVPGLNIQGYTAQVQNANVAQPYNIVGGCVAFCGVDSGVLLDGDVIVSANPCAFAGGLFGLVCVDSGAKLVMTGNTDWRTAGNTFFGSCIGWGAGTIDVFGRNTCALTANAATQFPSAGFVMRLNAGTVADSHTGAAPDVFNGGITISPANLNAAAGAAGFGGEAFVVSGAAYRMNTL